MYKVTSIETENLLKWSKLLEYDFFRLYSQHLILYAPAESKKYKKPLLPKFRKNIYTKEVIGFILSQIQSGEMSKFEVIEHYKIPKTTLYKWISKYKDEKNKYSYLMGKSKKEITELLGQDFNYYPADVWFYILSKSWLGRIKALLLYFKDEKVCVIKIKTTYGKISS